MYTNLQSTNNGSVEFSSCCDTFKLVYQNIIMLFDESQFINFYKNVDSCYQVVKKDKNKDLRDILFRTKLESMILCFSVNEISEMHYLMETAIIEFKNESSFSKAVV